MEQKNMIHFGAKLDSFKNIKFEKNFILCYDIIEKNKRDIKNNDKCTIMWKL